MIHLDSSFLIDLYRETAHGRPGGALDAIEALDPSEILAVSVHVLCEMRVGAEQSRSPLKEHEHLDEFLSNLLVVYPDDRFAPMFARVVAAIQRLGTSLAAMDTLIATAALIDDAPVLTRNVKDFSRVPGLRVLKY